jgi:hypothetical protein
MVLPLTEPMVAEIMVLPELTLLARPLLLMLATVGADDDHETWEVRFFMLPSL